ncbi:MAG: aminotransferase class I/II-fold pyridoxal phosphate-dependent enzyme [Prevotellaceae bacterium]|jgi:aromatic-L-amino-acid decarboxylase|nr:aminotransferase class I/II-fold pyridoxal phosphate-dependent enzyme [Prevotellaceae bacterium]
MITQENFRRDADAVLDWIDGYFKRIRDLPVKAAVLPREIFNKIEDEAPLEGEDIDMILRDLDSVLLPGITHWQHPSFHAYFPANSSYESLMGEMVTAAIGAQCMVWETSPAAAELEERLTQWMARAIGLPDQFTGVIQDSASSATLVAILTARERATRFMSNLNGVPGGLRVYCSAQAHSSIEKGVGVAGIGRNNLVKIETDSGERMNYKMLEKAINEDMEAGLTPICVVAALGTTGSVAIDPIDKIAAICNKYNVWLHVDGAYAGTALLLPEYRYIAEGVEYADSFVFNPHKWMFVNFDCSLYYIKDPQLLVRTFDILPEYLKTATHGQVNDYRDWGIPLGRRFRALKLWFVLRGFGLEGIRQRIREQIALNEYFARKIEESGHFKLLKEPFLGFTLFRTISEDDTVTQKVLEEVNRSGEIYLSHTRVDGTFAIRFHATQTYVQKEDIDKAVQTLNRYYQIFETQS